MSLCTNPHATATGQIFPCGQCMPCRINKKRIWTHRILLEAAQYEDNCFVTLTYDDDHLPKEGSLVPKHSQDWLKRFRFSVAPLRIRYFLVGEYGDTSFRPHYHCALFNFPPCRYLRSRYSRSIRHCCASCDIVRDTWGKGQVSLGTLEAHSAQYVAGYVTKKMTSKNDPRLEGRHPEFSRQSNRPGIGADAMHDVASVLMQFNLDTSEPDVPSALRHGSRILPLGSYLTRRLRKLVGKDEKAPQSKIDALNTELLPLRYAAKSSASHPSLKSQIQKANKGRSASLEARAKINRKRGNL